MTAAANDITTRSLGDEGICVQPPPVPVKAGRVIYCGTIVMLSAAGFATDVAAASQLCFGRALQTVDNTLGADGALTVATARGVSAWTNDGSDPIVAADLGKTVYMTDNQTVCHTSTGKSPVGKFVGFSPTESGKVYVEVV